MSRLRTAVSVAIFTAIFLITVAILRDGGPQMIRHLLIEALVLSIISTIAMGCWAALSQPAIDPFAHVRHATAGDAGDITADVPAVPSETPAAVAAARQRRVVREPAAPAAVEASRARHGYAAELEAPEPLFKPLHPALASLLERADAQHERVAELVG